MAVFLTVNGRDVSLERAVRHALLDAQGRSFVESLIEHELLRQHARSIGLAVSPDELQRAADEMRYQRGLTTRERTLEWVRAHGTDLGVCGGSDRVAPPAPEGRERHTGRRGGGILPRASGRARIRSALQHSRRERGGSGGARARG